MWGLVLKDFYISKKTIIFNYLYCVAGFILIAFCSKMPSLSEDIDKQTASFLLTILIAIIELALFMGCSNMIISFIKEDEKMQWQNYIVSSPIIIKKQVLTKYLEILTMYGLAYVITVIGCAIVKMMSGITINNKMALYMALFVAFQTAIELPIVFKIGSRYVNYFKIGFLFTIVYGVVLYLLYGKLPDILSIDSAIDFFSRIIQNEPDAINKYKRFKDVCKYAFPIGIALLCVISFFVSCKIYNPEKTLEKE